MTAWDRLEERSIQKGVEQGIQQGKRALLLRVLRSSYGNQVTADIERRITTATDEQLEIWIDRLCSAPRLAQLLAD